MSDFFEVCSYVCNWKEVLFGSDHGLVQNRWHVIILTYNGNVFWPIYISLILDYFMVEKTANAHNVDTTFDLHIHPMVFVIFRACLISYFHVMFWKSFYDSLFVTPVVH